MTKYDQEIAARNERAYRKLNIETLQKQLDQAKNVLAVIPRDGWQSQQERQTVQAEIRRLTEYIEDEKRAYDATFAAGVDVDSIINKMDL